MTILSQKVMNNFAQVSDIDEEKALIEALDKNQWIKLLNRRVQHYGFEFVYGANNVDKTRKLGDMPDFLTSIIQSKDLGSN